MARKAVPHDHEFMLRYRPQQFYPCFAAACYHNPVLFSGKQAALKGGQPWLNSASTEGDRELVERRRCHLPASGGWQHHCSQAKRARQFMSKEKSVTKHQNLSPVSPSDEACPLQLCFQSFPSTFHPSRFWFWSILSSCPPARSLGHGGGQGVKAAACARYSSPQERQKQRDWEDYSHSLS